MKLVTSPREAIAKSREDNANEPRVVEKPLKDSAGFWAKARIIRVRPGSLLHAAFSGVSLFFLEKKRRRRKSNTHKKSSRTRKNSMGPVNLKLLSAHRTWIMDLHTGIINLNLLSIKH